MSDTRTITMNGIEIYLDTRTTDQWTTVSRVIPKGFICVELTTDGKCKMKCGDGINTYANLPYVGGDLDMTKISESIAIILADYYTKTETDNAISDAISNLGNLFRFKGRVDSIDKLPVSDNQQGDIYLVGLEDASEFEEYYYTGTFFDYLGKTTSIDLIDYYKKTEINNLLNNKADKIVEFEESTSRQQLKSGENIITLFGKIKKFFSDLKNICFSGSYNDLTDTPIIDSELSGVSENSVQNKVIKSAIDTNKQNCIINKTSIGTQCKNMLENVAETATVNGVTFTVNDDKSVTVNGTASGDAVFSINDAVNGAVKFHAGENFRLTGCPIGGSGSSYYLSFGNNKDYGEGIIFEGTDEKIGCEIIIKSGCSVNNITFYPMICYSEIIDTAYEKYSPSLNTIVQSKQNSVRVWITDGYSLNIGSRNLIEILGMSLVGVKHRHYVKLLRAGNEVFVMAEDKGGSDVGVNYEYTINNNVLTITNKGSYGHWLLILY